MKIIDKNQPYFIFYNIPVKFYYLPLNHTPANYITVEL